MDNNLSITYKKAAINKVGLDALLSKVAQRSHAKVMTNFKNPDTAEDKVDRKQIENPKRNYSLGDVNDIARGRLVYNSVDGVEKGLQTLKDLVKRTPLKIEKVQDFFKKPQEGGYRGLHVDLGFPNGQHVEVQLHTPQSYAATLLTHEAHEEFGDKMPPETAEHKDRVNNQIMQLPNSEAKKLAAQQEAKNAPLTLEAQMKAALAMQGSPTPQNMQSMGNEIPQNTPTTGNEIPQLPNRGNPEAAVASPMGQMG